MSHALLKALQRIGERNEPVVPIAAPVEFDPELESIPEPNQKHETEIVDDEHEVEPNVEDPFLAAPSVEPICVGMHDSHPAAPVSDDPVDQPSLIIDPQPQSSDLASDTDSESPIIDAFTRPPTDDSDSVQSLLQVLRERNHQNHEAEASVFESLRESVREATAELPLPDEEDETERKPIELDTDDIQQRLSRFVAAEPTEPALTTPPSEPFVSPEENQEEPSGIALAASDRPVLRDDRFAWTPGQGTSPSTVFEHTVSTNLNDKKKSSQYRSLMDNLLAEFQRE